MKKPVYLLLFLLMINIVTATETCDVDVLTCGEDTINNIDEVFKVTPIENDEPYCVFYFYGRLCPHCANIKPFLEEMEQKYDKFRFRAFEVQFNASNKEMFDDFCFRFDVQKKGVPAIFISYV